MGAKEKDEKMNELKEESQGIENALKTEKNPAKHLEIYEGYMDSISANQFGSEAHVGFFENEMLPRAVFTLLKRTDFGPSVILRVNRFLQKVIGFAMNRLSSNSVPLITSVSQIFYHQNLFFKHSSHVQDVEDSLLSEEEEQIFDESTFEQHPPLFAKNIRYFVGMEGLQLILQHIETSNPKVNFTVLKCFLRWLSRIATSLESHYLEPYFQKLQEVILALVESLTTEDLKNEPTRVLFEISEELQRVFERGEMEGTEEITEGLTLTMALKCFQSPFLEKRLAALTEVRDCITTLQDQNTYPSRPVRLHWMTLSYLSEWIQKHQFIESAFHSQNPELLKRSVDLLKFLASRGELSPALLSLVWTSSRGKHESLTRLIYGILEELAPSLRLSDFEFLFDQFKEIPYSQYDVTFLLLLRAISSHGIIASTHRWFGLDIFWDLFIRDDSGLPFEVTSLALNYLSDFLHWPPCYPQRVPYLERAIQQIVKGEGVLQSIQLLLKVIPSYGNPEAPPSPDTPASVIEWLEETHGLLDLVLMDLQRYYAQGEKQEEREDTKDLTPIRNRLEFLEYILSQSSLELSQGQLETFWSSAIEGSGSEGERDAAFQWLGEAVEGRDSLTEEGIEFLFLQKFPQLDVTRLSPLGFNCFERFFRHVNSKRGFLRLSQDRSHHFSPEFSVTSFELLGLDSLWRIIVEATESLVGQEGISLLLSLLHHVDSSLRSSVGEQVREWIQRCMQFLSQASQECSQGMLTPGSELRLHRSLDLLRVLLRDFEPRAKEEGPSAQLKIQVHQGNNFTLPVSLGMTVGHLRILIGTAISHPPEGLRLIVGGRELEAKENSQSLSQVRLADGYTLLVSRRATLSSSPVGAAISQIPKEIPTSDPMEEEETKPSTLLSQEKEFSQLFQVLEIPSAAGKAWEILLALPPNPRIYSQIRELGQTPSPIPWETIFPPSPFALLYALRLAEELLSAPPSPEWKEAFLRKGGVAHLGALLGMPFHSERLGEKRKSALALLLFLLQHFMVELKEISGPKPTDPTQTVPMLSQPLLESDPEIVPKMLPKLLEIIWHSAVPSQEETVPLFSLPTVLRSPEEDDSVIVERAMLLLVGSLLSQAFPVNTFLLHSSLPDWVRGTLLSSPEKTIRQKISFGLLQICQHVNDPSLGPLLPSLFFLNLLLSFFPELPDSLPTGEQYFSLLERLVRDTCQGGESPPQLEQLFLGIMGRLQSHPILERRHSPDLDVFFIGCCRLATALVSFHANFKERAGQELQSTIFSYLFEIPSPSADGPLTPPLCKTKESRQAAFDFLTELARNNLSNFSALVRSLVIHHPPDVEAEGMSQVWNYLPSAYDKSPTGYVGLRNLGATCYMNSLIQQFFMIPELRKGLLSVPLEETAAVEGKSLDDNPLYQLQLILAHLQEGAKKYIDTRPFCHAYKPMGEPVNPLIQMDADEFFNVLLDHLENLLRPFPQARLLQEVFGGQLCNQVLSQECSHVSERTESFFTLSLEIKNQKSIEDSLTLFTQGDMLDGDNKYFCGTCQKKVDALKRSCVASLPPHLIFHAKRFEFDLELLRRVKVNDFCQFPERLSMAPYTKEVLSGTPLPHPPSYYDYRLSGILVHSGSADSGHYYSFIKNEANEWYQFNDTDVEPFDPKDIPASCFGGMDTVSHWDPVAGKHVPRYVPKIYSGYMLFYERAREEEMPKESRGKAQVPKEIYNQIWRDNLSFLRHKSLFDPLYFRFVTNVISLGLPLASQTTSPVVPLWALPVEESDPGVQSIQLSTQFLFGTLLHAKERTILREHADTLAKLLGTHLGGTRWFLEHLLGDSQWARQALLGCPTAESREILSRLFLAAIKVSYDSEAALISQDLENDEEADSMDVEEFPRGSDAYPLLRPPSHVPKTLTLRVFDMFLGLLPEVAGQWKHGQQYFLMFKEFVKWGSPAIEVLAHRCVAAQFIDFYLGDHSPEAPKGIPRKKMSEKGTTFKASYLLEFLSLFYRSSHRSQGPPPPSLLPESVPLNSLDGLMGTLPAFYLKAVKENPTSKAPAEMAVHLSWEHLESSQEILNFLCKAIDTENCENFPPYLALLLSVLSLPDSLSQQRIHYFLPRFIKVLHSNLQYPQATTATLEFLQGTLLTLPAVGEWLAGHVSSWLLPPLQSPSSAIRESTAALLVSTLPQYPAWPVSSSPKDFFPPTVPDLPAGTLTLLEKYLGFLSAHLSHFPPGTRVEGKGEETLWRSETFFRLLRFLTPTSSQASQVGEALNELILAFAHFDSQRLPCDRNKLEVLLTLSHLVALHSPLEEKLSESPLNVKVLDCVVAAPVSERLYQYNQQFLPPFYSLLLRLASRSFSFAEKLAKHQNFAMAIDSFLFKALLPQMTQLLFSLLGAVASYESLRGNGILLILRNYKLKTYSESWLKSFDLILRSTEDFVLFTKEGGLLQLAEFISSPTEPSLPLLKEAIVFFARVTEWMEGTLPKDLDSLRFGFLSMWESQKEFLARLFSLISEFPEESDLTSICYSLAVRVSRWTPSHLSTVLRFFEVQLPSLCTPSPPFFLPLCVTLCEISPKESKDLVLSLLPVVTSRSLIPRVAHLLTQLWDEEGKGLAQEKAVQNFFQQLLRVSLPLLDSDLCFLFVQRSAPELLLHVNRSELIENAVQKVTSLLSHFQASAGEDPTLAYVVEQFIHVFKALHVLHPSPEDRKNFIQQHPTLLPASEEATLRAASQNVPRAAEFRDVVRSFEGSL